MLNTFRHIKSRHIETLLWRRLTNNVLISLQYGTNHFGMNHFETKKIVYAFSVWLILQTLSNIDTSLTWVRIVQWIAALASREPILYFLGPLFSQFRCRPQQNPRSDLNKNYRKCSRVEIYMHTKIGSWMKSSCWFLCLKVSTISFGEGCISLTHIYIIKPQ